MLQKKQNNTQNLNIFNPMTDSNEIKGYYNYPVANISFHAKINSIPSKLERIEGCLLGGTIGDAF